MDQPRASLIAVPRGASASRWCVSWRACCWRPPTAFPAAPRSGAATRRGWSTSSARHSSRWTGSPLSGTRWCRRSTRITAGLPAPTRPWRRSPTARPGWPLDAGLDPMRGPGLVVTLNDAQRDAEGRFPRDATPDDLVVHQQDIQAVLNALWSAGAEGIQMQDQRIIGTSAPRCVGQHAAAERPHVQPAVRHHRDRRRRRHAGRAGGVTAGDSVQAVRRAVRVGV